MAKWAGKLPALLEEDETAAIVAGIDISYKQ